MRVPRTFVFVDLTGFTNYTAENGDDEAGRLLSRFRAATREVASERGVRVAKWLGDGAMIVCLDRSDAIATALDLECRTAVACAPLALRAGVAGGYALLFEGDDYIGSAVNPPTRWPTFPRELSPRPSGRSRSVASTSPCRWSSSADNRPSRRETTRASSGCGPRSSADRS